MKKILLEDGTVVEFTYNTILYDAIKVAYSLKDNDEITEQMIVSFFKDVVSNALDKAKKDNLE